MNKRAIEETITKKFNEWINSIENEELVELLKKNVIISGGCIASMYLNEDVSDFDIYFTNEEIALKVNKYYNARFDAKESKSKKYRPIYLTNNAVTLSDNMQCVTKFYGGPEEICGNFDFVHVTNYWDVRSKKIVINLHAIESILTKTLIYIGSAYPIASLIRIRKFIKRGWYIGAGQLLKMAVRINGIDLNDIGELKNQLHGVDASYFDELINLIEKGDFPENEGVTRNRQNRLDDICLIVDKYFQ